MPKKESGTRRTISIEGIDPVCLLGPADANLHVLAKHYRTRVVVRSGRVRLSGPAEEEPELLELFHRLMERCRKGEVISPELVEAEIRRRKTEGGGTNRQEHGESKRRKAEKGARNSETGTRSSHDELTVRTPRKTIITKGPNQQAYLRAIAQNDIILAIGPAGTGKTYLAVAVALEAFVSGRANRIVLTRPAVEAGESLGYLPGTFREKVDPYLRPLYDALFDMMPIERVKRLIEEEVIEVAPLAYMRGRTLSDSYIILDEAQNTTSTQMRMFLTRLGWNSKTIVTGDITQIDLAQPDSSGLVEAEQRLHSVKGISICRFTEKDVVRPPLVSRIITAYERKMKTEG